MKLFQWRVEGQSSDSFINLSPLYEAKRVGPMVIFRLGQRTLSFRFSIVRRRLFIRVGKLLTEAQMQEFCKI